MEISSKSKKATVPDHSVDEDSGPRACESGFLAVTLSKAVCLLQVDMGEGVGS